MAEIKILIEGCAREIKNGWTASSTVVLTHNYLDHIYIK